MKLHKTADTFTAGAKTLPQRYFVSPEIFAEEEEKIFSAQWVLVGHQSQIAKAGDYFVQEVAGESIIIMRDQKEAVRAFYNVCRHRGTRLCEERSGHSAAIQCPYHAWTYGLDGRLIGAPHMDEVPEFDKTPVRVARSEPRGLGGIYLRKSRRQSNAAGGMVRAVGRKILSLESAEAALGETDLSTTSGPIGS